MDLSTLFILLFLIDYRVVMWYDEGTKYKRFNNEYDKIRNNPDERGIYYVKSYLKNIECFSPRHTFCISITKSAFFIAVLPILLLAQKLSNLFNSVKNICRATVWASFVYTLFK